MNTQTEPGSTPQIAELSPLVESAQARYHLFACISLIALLLLLVSWEWFLAPLRPGGSWLVLKIIPLLFPLSGILKRDNYTLQWSSMLIFIYFSEGIVRGVSDPSWRSSALAWGEVALSLAFFFSTIFYLRPHKIIAKKLKKAAQEKQDALDVIALKSQNAA